ncbi:MAG: HD-GYP domain-containing protein [Bacillota bacterium]|nr:HD-GYP domain-containing protein [Bacillota bacterium]
MRLVPVSVRAVGKRLARPIYAETGKPLLEAGVTLTERYIEALAARGVQGVYVEDALAPDLDPAEDALSERTRVDATVAVRKVFEKAGEGDGTPMREVVPVVEAIVDEVFTGKSTVMGLYLMRDYDEFIYAHGVNVCVYSVALGATLGLSKVKLVELGTGALLHDLGKIRFPPGLNDKSPSEMDEAERIVYEQHTTDGYNMIRSDPELSLLSAHVAYQHHERWDGQGFPRRLRGDGIHLYGRIAAIADAFDNLTSRRPGPWEPLPEVKAGAKLLEAAGGAYEPRLVSMFLKQLALYPVGTIVRLSNGFLGVVSRSVRGDPLRPWVRVLADGRNERLAPFELSLAENRHLEIAAVLPEYPPELAGTEVQG